MDNTKELNSLQQTLVPVSELNSANQEDVTIVLSKFFGKIFEHARALDTSNLFDPLFNALDRIPDGLDHIHEASNSDSKKPKRPPFVSLTPGSDLVFGKFDEYQLIFGRGGDDTLFPFDHSLSSTQTDINIDLFVGDSDQVGTFLFQDLLNILEGNPPSIRTDRFVLGDWNRSYYTNAGYNDFAFIVDFNPKQDVIQLRGTAADYQFVSVPSLGTAIFKQKTVGNADLVGVVWNFDLVPTGTNVQYAGNVPPGGPVQPKTKQLGTAGIDLGFAIATGPKDSVYVTGVTNTSLEGTNAGSYDAWIAKYNKHGNQVWLQQFGSYEYDLAVSIATDKYGNLYVAGSTQGDLAGLDPQTKQDSWLAKYDSDGNQLWIRRLAVNSDVSSTSEIDIDDSGNVYLTGITITGDKRPEAIIGTQDDFWVTKYDSDGNQKWFTKVGTPESYPAIWDEAYGVSVAKDGSVYATGWTYGGLARDNTNIGFYDSWISKFDNQGQLEWIQQFGSAAHDFSWSIDTDSRGNVYAYGWTEGSLGGVNAGKSDPWLVKYSADGTQSWARQFGTSGNDAAFLGGLEIDSSDNIFLTGYTDGNLGGPNNGSFDTFVASYDINGNQNWIQQFGTSKLDYSTDITVDDKFNLYVTGFTEGSFGDINAGAVDTWIAKLDALSGTLETFNQSASPTIVRGTSDRDELIGGDLNSRLIGFQGPDLLTGGGGNDQFYYTSMVDAGDTITDFEVGSDKIVFSKVLKSLGYQGTDPIADGYVQFEAKGTGSLIQIDPDGLGGPGRSRPFILIEDVAVSNLNNASNFII